MADALPSWVQPGAKFKWLGRVYHVRGIIDDGAVCRWWRRAKQRWEYEWVHPVSFMSPTNIKQHS